MNNVLHKVFDWIWLSSADPTKVSLSVKGFLTVVAGSIIPLVGLTHLNLGSDQVNTVIDSISTTVQDGLMLVGAIGGTVGIIQKVWLTLMGKNQVTAANSPSVPPAPQPQA